MRLRIPCDRKSYKILEFWVHINKVLARPVLWSRQGRGDEPHPITSQQHAPPRQDLFLQISPSSHRSVRSTTELTESKRRLTSDLVFLNASGTLSVIAPRQVHLRAHRVKNKIKVGFSFLNSNHKSHHIVCLNTN